MKIKRALIWWIEQAWKLIEMITELLKQIFGIIGETAKPIEQIIEEIMADVPESEFDKLPKDGASEHDHYLYGTEKKSKKVQ